MFSPFTDVGVLARVASYVLAKQELNTCGHKCKTIVSNFGGIGLIPG